MTEGKKLNRAIKVKMIFFGPLVDEIGTREIIVALQRGTALIELADQFHLSAQIGNGLRVAIDGEITDDFDQILNDGAELAFLPPVSVG